jgi:SAM-dependent methyltransferase
VSAFNTIWENEIYSQGRQIGRYPYDSVVSFVFRYAPRDRERSAVNILEIGCGTGNNLWFAAREGFSVAGIDGSATAIDYARKRFAEEGLAGDLRVGDFTSLPFEDTSFDMVIERGALVCVGRSACRRAVSEAHRVLKPGGLLFANPYSDKDSSAFSGIQIGDGLRDQITEGMLTGVGALCFYGRGDVEALFAAGWKTLSIQHAEVVDVTGLEVFGHAEWRIVAERLPGCAASLRLAGAEDKECVFRWRNDPFIVERSSSRKGVEWDAHSAWFDKSLESNDHLILLVETAGAAAGLIRFECRGNDAVITAYLMPEFTGRGLGVSAIAKACVIAFGRWPGVRAILAFVRDDNREGQSAFAKSGFVRSQDGGDVPPRHTLFIFNRPA